MADAERSPSERRFILVEIWSEHRKEIKILVGGAYFSLVAIALLFVIYAAIHFGGNAIGYPPARIEKLERLDFWGIYFALGQSVILLNMRLFSVMVGRK